MRIIMLATLLVVGVATACARLSASGTPDDSAPVPAFHGTRWVLDALIDGEASRPVPPGVEAWIRFGENGLATGNAGCNEIGGGPDGNYSADAAWITFHDVVSTMRACGEPRDSVERAVLMVLDGEVGYRIEGATLTLRHPSGKGLRFRAR